MEKCSRNNKLSQSSKASMSRDIEKLCEQYRAIKSPSQKSKFKENCIKLIQELWFHDNSQDHMVLRGSNLMYLVEEKLEDIEDCFGMGFLDMNKATLHFFAYFHDDENIRKFSEKPEMARIFAK